MMVLIEQVSITITFQEFRKESTSLATRSVKWINLQILFAFSIGAWLAHALTGQNKYRKMNTRQNRSLLLKNITQQSVQKVITCLTHLQRVEWRHLFLERTVVFVQTTFRVPSAASQTADSHLYSETSGINISITNRLRFWASNEVVPLSRVNKLSLTIPPGESVGLHCHPIEMHLIFNINMHAVNNVPLIDKVAQRISGFSVVRWCRLISMEPSCFCLTSYR